MGSTEFPSTRHLAGALASRSGSVLPAVPEWRWMLERGECPWYASARLLRQLKVGDWASVFRMAEELPRQMETAQLRRLADGMPSTG
jgi:hypothetical protein